MTEGSSSTTSTRGVILIASDASVTRESPGSAPSVGSSGGSPAPGGRSESAIIGWRSPRGISGCTRDLPRPRAAVPTSSRSTELARRTRAARRLRLRPAGTPHLLGEARLEGLHVGQPGDRIAPRPPAQLLELHAHAQRRSQGTGRGLHQAELAGAPATARVSPEIQRPHLLRAPHQRDRHAVAQVARYGTPGTTRTQGLERAGRPDDVDGDAVTVEGQPQGFDRVIHASGFADREEGLAGRPQGARSPASLDPDLETRALRLCAC